MPLARSSRTLGAVTPDDFQRLAGLRRMQAIALGLLLAMAVVFVVSFAFQEHVPWLAYVRAASEGGMVGAVADWFAVTALFRRPLGLPIPHTNLISHKKDEIGAGLGSFVEENFLSDEVVHEKLSQISGARLAGEWLGQEKHAKSVADAVASVGLGALTVLNDSDVQELIEALVRKHVIEPAWGPTLGRATESFVAGGHHEALLDIAADHLGDWLEANPRVFDKVVSSRLPSWVPSVVDRFVDDRLHSEAVRFARQIRSEHDHPFRLAVGQFLQDLARDLGDKPSLNEQLESYKREVFDSPRVRALAASTWSTARGALVEMLQDPESELRRRIARATQDFGHKLEQDPTLQYKVDVWVMGVAEHLVRTYRADLSGVIVETVQRWDAQEAAEKIELQIGKDLQFIRINGTIVGSLAGLAIFTFAQLVIAPLVG
ncbi:DUF445 family protein [Leucobacter sp. cx-169]|nr:DUF445 family protein [Leucobacter sp. cx-169]